MSEDLAFSKHISFNAYLRFACFLVKRFETPEALDKFPIIIIIVVIIIIIIMNGYNNNNRQLLQSANVFAK